CLPEDARADFLRGRRGSRKTAPILRHVEIGFIERQRFDQRGVLGEDRVDLARDRAIDVEARRHEHQLRTLAHGRGRRHGRSNTEGARLVTRCGNHAPLGAVADGDRTASKLRIVALFDRRIERVHVDMDDLAQRHTSNYIRPGTERELRAGLDAHFVQNRTLSRASLYPPSFRRLPFAHEICGYSKDGYSSFKPPFKRAANGERHGHEPLARFGEIVQLPHVGTESASREYGCYAVVPPGVGLSASRKAFAAAKLSLRDAGIVIVSPVPGLRPWRSATSFTLKRPKPDSATSSPAVAATRSISSVVFIGHRLSSKARKDSTRTRAAPSGEPAIPRAGRSQVPREAGAISRRGRVLIPPTPAPFRNRTKFAMQEAPWLPAFALQAAGMDSMKSRANTVPTTARSASGIASLSATVLRSSIACSSVG